MPPETGTGATPGAGATPAQPPTTTPAGATPQAPQPPTATEPATGDESALGDVGKRILAEARRAAREAEDRAKAAEQERDSLKVATQSEAEKARDAAVREAITAERARSDTMIRRARVESALRAAGLTSDRTIALAAQAPEFADLKVDDKGDLTDLAGAVEAFKKVYEELFPKPTPPPAPTLGAQTGGTIRRATLEEAIAAHYKSK